MKRNLMTGFFDDRAVVTSRPSAPYVIAPGTAWVDKVFGFVPLVLGFYGFRGVQRSALDNIIGK